MVVIIRDNECIEPRIKTYENYLLDRGIPFLVLGWDRKGISTDDEHHLFFKKHAEYGKKLLNIVPKIEWMRFVNKELKRREEDISLIHACDVDAVIPSYCFAKHNHIKIIFDIFDWISSVSGNKIVFGLIEKLENFYYKKCDYVIICEEERKSQAKTPAKKLLVMPNIPYKEYSPDCAIIEDVNERSKKYRITLGYVGVFDYNRGIEDLLAAVGSMSDVLLEIAGYGGLVDAVTTASEKYENIHFWGSVDYDKGQTILSQTDMIVAFYYLTNPVHVYAAPNKYYEALKLHKPLLTNKGTILGDKVKKYNTGYVIDEGEQSVLNTLKCISNNSELRELKENASEIWDKKYKDYIDRFLNDEYGVICN